MTMSMSNGAVLFQIPNSLIQSNFPNSHKTTHSLFSIQFPKLKFHLSVSSSKTPQTQETFDFDEEEDEDDDDIIVPLSHMRQWTRNKPSGFGEGKVYDTSLEDKLLEEFEQSRVANGNPISKLPKHKEAEVVPSGIRVRLVNLPKKKNIHRDLQAAFKSFTGIIKITPAVSGNEKTRVPLCKGFAFLHFNSLKEANRFVDVFSTQPITFGKVQKQIRCEIMKSNPAPVPVLSAVNSNEPTPNFEDDTSTVGDDEQLVLATDAVVEKHVEKHEGQEPLKKQKKGKKTNSLGSANRLKMKEKALLSGVFSKYGGKSSD